MIEFETITVKNFCSYGNYPTSIQLNKDATTLVVGKNGAGKSTILLDGIFFVLFDKPYRKVTKGQLVNSINKGGTIVELTFNTKNSKYLIRRGIKPNLFEIEKDGKKLDNTVRNKDLQSHLEEDILKLNIKTFGQTVVLGSSSYVPFMQLDAAKRREVVDDVLGVSVFTTMSDLAKEDLSITNKELQKIDTEYQICKNNSIMQKNLITVMESNKDDIIEGYKSDIGGFKEDIHNLELLNENLLDKIENEKKNIVDVTESSSSLESEKVRLLSSLQTANKKVQEFEHMAKCPTCFQQVEDLHKDTLLTRVNDKIQQLEEAICQIDKKLPDVYLKEESNFKASTNIQYYKSSIEENNREINRFRNQIKSIEQKLNDISSDNDSKIQTEKDKLKQLITEAKSLKKTIDELQQTKAIQELSVKLLKDNGIKASIVKEYLPIFNSLVNQNLKEYGFDIQLSLDENFKESINSRGRENFSYYSFSEGEKEKIDYSIMLALRKIAITKNAAHINVLNLDEILDGSLDQESRNVTLDILSRDVDKSNIFVISHTESNPGFYDTILCVEKKGDFSTIKVDN